MNHLNISAITLAVSMTAGASLALAQGPRAAPTDSIGGEVLVTHHCTTHGYTLRVIRPAGYAAEDSDARQIQVEYAGKHFHAMWNEVSNLIDNFPPQDLEYNQLPNNPGPEGRRYCIRTGHLIPTDQTVYQVTLAHYNNYNGNSSIYFDSNADTAPLHFLVAQYNNTRDQGDALPSTCPMGCLDLPDPGDDNDDGWTPGTYTSADGEVHNLFDLSEPGVGDSGGGTTVRPSVDSVERVAPVTSPVDTGAGSRRDSIRTQRSRVVQPETDAGSVGEPIRTERTRAAPQ